MAEAFICEAIRTPFGRYAGALSRIRADALAALPLRARRPPTTGTARTSASRQSTIPSTTAAAAG